MTFYDLLLRLYPASFRNEYGEEMREMFLLRWQEASALGTLWLPIAAVVEVAGNAAAVHGAILRQDVAYTWRTLARAPGFAITAILVVALGIGATTAAFSVTDFVLLRPLAFPEPHRLVKLWQKTPGYPRMELSPPNYRDWRAASTSFESMAVYVGAAVTYLDRGEPTRLEGASVGAELFRTLRVEPLLGRTFSAADDSAGAAGTIVLSYGLWQTVFAGDGGIAGRILNLDGRPYTVIGVMPRAFHFPDSDTQFWIANRFGEADYQNRTNNMLEAVGRLRDGVTIAQASAEMERIGAESARLYPRENKDTGAAVIPLRDEISQRARVTLLALSGAAACLLLIACANLANLLLARALSRRREMAVRTAIGAGRERLVRQLMTESLLIASVGGALGIGLAAAGVPLLATLVPSQLPAAAEPSVDLRVLILAVGLTVSTGLVFGLIPVLRVGRSPDLDGLREGVRSGGAPKDRVRSALVVAQIVASIVLLVSAGLLLRALLTVQRIDPGFDARGVLSMRVDLPPARYARVADREAFYARVLQEVRALPGVTAAGFVSFLPISSFRGGIWPVSVPGDVNAADEVRSQNNVASIRYVTPGFFDALRIPITRGRDIREADSGGRQFAAVVSESFVKRYWPGQDPIGRHFTFAFADREVVGVAADVRFRGLERISEPQVYLSSKQVPDGAIVFYSPRDLAIRASVAEESLMPAVRAIIRQADPTLPIIRVQTLSAMVNRETATRMVQVRIVSAFALMAFVLAAVGVHGLLSFAVSHRTQEIGVRIALGARPGDVLGMVVGRCARLAVAGVVPGVVLALLAGRSMEALLAGVEPADPLTLAAAVALCVVMTILGCLAPALRAIRIDPITALRAE